MGDAVCSFNPVYGQGMSVAAIEAQTLDRCLCEQEMLAGNTGVVGFTKRFQQAIARDIKTPWLLSTGEDLRYPGAEGKRSLSIRLFNRYMRRVIELTASEPRMAATLLRVRTAQTLVNAVPATHHPGRASSGTGHIQAAAWRDSASQRGKRASQQQLRAGTQRRVSREIQPPVSG